MCFLLDSPTKFKGKKTTSLFPLKNLKKCLLSCRFFNSQIQITGSKRFYRFLYFFEEVYKNPLNKSNKKSSFKVFPTRYCRGARNLTGDHVSMRSHTSRKERGFLGMIWVPFSLFFWHHHNGTRQEAVSLYGPIHCSEAHNKLLRMWRRGRVLDLSSHERPTVLLNARILCYLWHACHQHLQSYASIEVT